MGASKLPYPPVKPNVEITVNVTQGLTTTGAQDVKDTYTGLGFYNERHAWVQDSEGKRVESKGIVIFFHDVCAGVEELTGNVKIGNLTKSIIVGKRLRNPDGSVHHVELELM